VGVQTLPALPSGNNVIGKVAQSGTWAVEVTAMPPINVTVPPMNLTDPLPTGSNTIGKVDINGSVPVTGTFWQAVQPVSLTSLPALPTGTNTIGNVGIVGTVPVSGTFWQSVQPISATSLPLPSNAAQETGGNLATIAARTPTLGQTTKANSVPVVLASDHGSIPVTGTFWQATQPVSIAALPALPAGSNNIGNVGIIGTVPVSGTFWQSVQPVSSTQLPAGLGQTTMVNSLPVVLASNQSAIPVTGTFWQATQPVSLASLPPLPAGTNTIGNVNVNGTVPVSGIFWQATQPVSIAALPALAAGNNLIGKVQLSDGTNQPAVKAASTAPVAGDPALVVAISPNSPAHPVSISGSVAVTGTFWQATQPISAAALPLPTGAATETTLSALNTKIPAQGQALMAASTPVVIASDQSAVPVSGTFWQATQPVSAASLPLPSGAATETTLAALNTKIPALGQAAMAASTPVVIASNQSAIPVSGTFWQATQPVSLASLPALPTGTNTIGSVKLTDGTNVPAVKAASTAPAATDPALVVTISPNSSNQRVQSYIDPTVGALLTNVTTNSTGPTVTCSHAYKTFAFKLTNTGSATITIYASADNSIYVPVATFKLDDTNTPSDGLTTGATGHTKFYALVSGISGSPTLNGSVVGVF
jgi:hypothetical protein